MHNADIHLLNLYIAAHKQYMHIYACTYIRINIQIAVRYFFLMATYIYVRMHIHLQIYTYIRAYNLYTYARTYVYIYVYVCVRISRLTIVRHKAKKQQQLLSELFTWNTTRKHKNALVNPP